jgi:hypothetical protein
LGAREKGRRQPKLAANWEGVTAGLSAGECQSIFAPKKG